ncbi:S-adenosyl-L-methionine-dependent methyltransferase [Dipodascopsis tothii]|uniref:S-adenosyl-L-methionine-dependent methyltransferase n=1 Tax=Dipodascopsis tothii TaxID=44089 RepID=UPI0034CFC85A
MPPKAQITRLAAGKLPGSLADWRKRVPRTYSRLNIGDTQLATALASELSKQYSYSNDLTIIDGYPGVGLWSRTLNQALQPKKHVCLEVFRSYYQWLETYNSDLIANGQMSLVPHDPFKWTSYLDIVKEGLVSPPTVPLNRVHDSLLFTMNLTSVQGDQLLGQFLGCIGNRNWIQKYGRVRMLLWVRPTLAQKVLAQVGDVSRNKTSVLASAYADVRPLFAMEEYGTLPVVKAKQYDSEGNEIVVPKKRGRRTKAEAEALRKAEEENKAPKKGYMLIPPGKLMNDNVLVRGRAKNATYPQEKPLVLLEITPKENLCGSLGPDAVDPFTFEYVIKQLFVSRKTPVGKGSSVLGPGAASYLATKLSDRLLAKAVTDLDTNELLELTQQFQNWPFKPDHLFDSLEDEGENDASQANNFF